MKIVQENPKFHARTRPDSRADRDADRDVFLHARRTPILPCNGNFVFFSKLEVVPPRHSKLWARSD